jgi:hypothetical protein
MPIGRNSVGDRNIFGGADAGRLRQFGPWTNCLGINAGPAQRFHFRGKGKLVYQPY